MAGISDLNLGLFLQIAFSEGIRNQISQDFRDWEMVLKNKVGAPDGRQLNFMLQSSFGPAAIQYRGATQSAFPSAQQISVSEHSAIYKEMDTTIEIEYNLWNRAQKSPSKYAEPLALEVQSKTIAAKRRLAADFYADGTGVVCEAASVVDTPSLTAPQAVVTLSTSDSAFGSIGQVEYGDLLVAKSKANAVVTPQQAGPANLANFYAWRVKSKTRSPLLGGNDTVTLEPINSSGAVLTDFTTSEIVAETVFYRVGQLTTLNLSTFTGDYGAATEVLAGLESLVADDGRTIHGINMSGATAGTVLDYGAASIDTEAIEQLMNQVKIRVGQGAYSWKMLSMAPETHSTFVSGRETDRRFHSVEDNKRGIRFFAYQHGNDTLEAYTSEFVPKKRIYALPESKAGQKVFEFHGTDFETVKVNDSGAFHLGIRDGAHARVVNTYMEALLCLICKHPAAVGQLRNFTA